MLKYRFFYKEYSIRIIIMTVFFIALIFLQCGFKKRVDSIDVLYLHKFSDVFMAIQFSIPLFLIDNYKRNKEEIIRCNNGVLMFAVERIVLTFLMVAIIRIIGLMVYNLIIFNDFNFWRVVGRFLIADIASIILSFVIFNIFINRYVGMTIALIISVVLYAFKGLYFTALNTVTTNEVMHYKGIGVIYYVSLAVLLLALIISLYWRKEYVSD